MENKLYCIVDLSTNVCINTVMWNGETTNWTPPDNCLMLVCATTPAKNWKWNTSSSQWELEIKEGTGSIGYLWDGTYLITYDTMPTEPPPYLE